MGTPEFAVGILDSIVKENIHEIVGVITAADKPSGRGQKIKYSAVKEYALENNLKLLQPTNLKDESFLAELKSLNANLQIVVAFRMLPEVVWKMPEFGTFNLHASLLPDYRGAAPINWAIINGDKTTGVTTFFIDDKIDTGAIILSKEMAIAENENMGILHDKLMILGCEAVQETLDRIFKNNVLTTKQSDSKLLRTANKLNKENCKVDFSKNTSEIYNLIRGLSPYPTAWCYLKDGDNEYNIKIFEAEKEIASHNIAAGTIISTKKEIKIAAEDGFIKIISLQMPGKKKMLAHELLNGFTFSEKAIVF